MNNFDSLRSHTESSFGFLVHQGFKLVSRDFISPNSFRGGFLLNYSNGQTTLEVEYLEQQFEVRGNSIEIFGPKLHAGFGGNMFSSQHLIESLPSIAQSVRITLLPISSA